MKYCVMMSNELKDTAGITSFEHAKDYAEERCEKELRDSLREKDVSESEIICYICEIIPIKKITRGVKVRPIETEEDVHIRDY